MKNLSKLTGKKVFITGGTGFIGCRLAEILVTRYKADVTVLVRDFGKALRLGRLPVKFHKGDILNKSSLLDGLKDVDYVFHCAYGNKGSIEIRNKINIEGTQNIIDASLIQQVKTFVFLSTQSVYGISDQEWLTEESRKNPGKDDYAKSKLVAEEIVLKAYREKGLNTVILQPTAVYGPWAISYGTKIFQSLKKGRMPIIENGKGTCNAVYIDDLVQAMLLAAITKESHGNTFLINGPAWYTWKDFYSRFEKIINEECLVYETREEALSRFKKSSKRPSFFSVLFRVLKPDEKAIKELLKFKFTQTSFSLFKKAIPPSFYLKIRNRIKSNEKPKEPIRKTEKPVANLSPDAISFFLSPTKVKSKKAEKILSYYPEYDFENGFVEVGNWYKWFYNKQ